ncbi:MAG: hypothetical protein LBR26_04660 [Prevotella sp.]|jgi:hypothetical protein|nr:hypothetical protein [Prevotella sp.]
MSGVSFSYVASTNDESEAFKTMRRKHVLEASKFDDRFYLTQIFNYLADTYNSLAAACRNALKQKKEEEITDYLRRKLQNNEDFILEGFIVNTEARNQDKVIGYYDLKFEHSDWLNQYFVLECKPIDTTKSKIDAYIHKAIKSQDEDGGLYRFLINKYATNKPFGGMLGYIISGNPQQAIDNLKKRIQTFQITQGSLCFGNLQNSELLDTSIANFTYSFQSNHTRMYEGQIITPVHIFHLFFDLTQ